MKACNYKNLRLTLFDIRKYQNICNLKKIIFTFTKSYCTPTRLLLKDF